MDKGNVLIIGNSGVGKSTLINALLGEECAKTGWGINGTTDKLEIFENNELPFRIIDTIGFEPNFIRKFKAIDAVKRWSKESAKKGNENSQINLIWFCIDGTSSKLFDDTINSISQATKIWKSVPIVAIITKSYSKIEREKNIEMVTNAFANQKQPKNLKKIIPVVAETYLIDENNYVAPEGISELIEVTNELMPEGIKAAENDIYDYKLSRKRTLAQSIIGVSTASGAAVGAIPIPFADALILAPLEKVEIEAIGKIYEIEKGNNNLINTIIDIGTVSAAAKGTIDLIKAIPGINIISSVLNAIIAAAFVAAIGEATAYSFEEIYKGNKTVDDIDWVKKIVENKLASSVLATVKDIIAKINKDTKPSDIVKLVLENINKK